MRTSNQYIFYGSWFENLKDLPDNMRLLCYDHLCAYGLKGEKLPVDDPGLNLALNEYYRQIDQAHAAYEERIAKLQKAGSEGGKRSGATRRRKKTKIDEDEAVL